MRAEAATDICELLRELRGLCARLPVPQPSWHPYVALIAACRADFEHALELAAEQPPALELLGALVEGETELGFDAATSPDLAPAYERLEALPVPEGQHPYLVRPLVTFDPKRARWRPHLRPLRGR